MGTTTCEHERLDQRGRCTVCDEWAVLTGQVPVPIRREVPCAEPMCSLPLGHDGLHKAYA